ncbi:MAG: hypothetical protein ACFFD4_29450 [Candidatus Odinarchaeota archaeon]
MCSDLDQAIKLCRRDNRRRFINHVSRAGVNPYFKRTGLALGRFVNKK